MAKYPSFQIRAASMALLAMQAASGEAADGRGKVEPTASTTINISVSVASKYQLRRAGDARENGKTAANPSSGPLCLVSNAAPRSLPVRLLRSRGISPGPAETAVAPDKAASVTPCIPRGGISEVGLAPSDRLQGVQVMLIQPE